MKLLFKKMLVNMLVLMVVMLPLRNAFAMDMSMNHCEADSVEMEMTMMNHAGHQMPSSDLMTDQQEKKVTACACCNQCDGDCTGCVHISSAITFEFLQFSDLKLIELVSVVSDLLLTRTISPPSRPPLIL
ncbi:MAG: hypothetical protein ABUK13_06415 [Gammaproteobacteria bacterium]